MRRQKKKKIEKFALLLLVNYTFLKYIAKVISKKILQTREVVV